MRRTQQGFTLIELIMVIVILGILAATALPKFVNMGSEARYASLTGMVGSLNSAMNIAYAQYQILSATSSSVSSFTTSDGATVALTYGYPSGAAGGICNMVVTSSSSGFTCTATGGVATLSLANSTCVVTYTQAANTTTPPVIGIYVASGGVATAVAGTNSTC